MDHIQRTWGTLRPYAAHILIAACSIVVASAISSHATIAYADSQFRVIYSLDKRQNDREIVSLIDGAQSYAYFAIYYFDRQDIADALIRAKQRGVDVRGIVDRDSAGGEDAAVLARLLSGGIPVETQKHLDGIMHIKALVTDQAYASGSYNWTTAATESNDEILEIGADRSVHDQYLNIITRLLNMNE